MDERTFKFVLKCMENDVRELRTQWGNLSSTEVELLLSGVKVNAMLIASKLEGDKV